MSTPWEKELAELLSELSDVQQESLQLLGEKRQLLVDSDTNGLAALATREEQLIAKLEACHHRRSELLEQAAQEGLPTDSLSALTAALPAAQQAELTGKIKDAKARMRILHHHSLTNWVLVQRTLIHLSQMLEIIATGGRPEPTYRRGEKPHTSGSLVDHAA